MKKKNRISVMITVLLLVAAMTVTGTVSVFADEIAAAEPVPEASAVGSAEDDPPAAVYDITLPDAEADNSEDVIVLDINDLIEETDSADDTGLVSDQDEADVMTDTNGPEDDAVDLYEAPAAGEMYTREAALAADLPGVYITQAYPGENLESATIGIPSVAKQTLADHPTTESPAIIMGGAVNYEKKTGPTEYTPIEGGKLVSPYRYFRWGVMDEQIQNEDGTISTHKKLSGFDGSYYIVRVDVSEIINNIENPETKYLHVRQDDNKALMVAAGFDGTTFSNALGSKTGSYSLADNAAALKDTAEDDADKETP